ncbi:MAG: helix-turn-helix domain-containing protein [Actinomycetota bacterium]
MREKSQRAGQAGSKGQNSRATESLGEEPSHRFRAGLAALGLAELESALFVVLSEKGPLPSSRAAVEVAAQPGAVAEALQALIDRGFVKRLPGRPNKFTVASPDLTLPALLRKREAEIDAARHSIQDLMDRFRERSSRDRSDAEYVEIVAGLPGLQAEFKSLQATARVEILGCTKAPILVTSIDQGNPGQEVALSRRVINRWLYERSVLEEPGMMDDVRKYARLGEMSRVAESLPSKMFIIDRRVAFIHATEERDDGTRVVGVLTRHAELVATFHRLFELMWETAVPLFPETDEAVEHVDPYDPPLIECLLAGMKDASIARQLGVSQRTVARRISSLLAELEAKTRFTAGFKLGLRFRSVRDRELPTLPN